MTLSIAMKLRMLEITSHCSLLVFWSSLILWQQCRQHGDLLKTQLFFIAVLSSFVFFVGFAIWDERKQFQIRRDEWRS